MSDQVLFWAEGGGERRDTTRAARRIVALVVRAQGGDRRAFERLWGEHRRVVHAILLSRVPGRDAEDLLQDVAVAAWEGMSGLRDAASFRGWLSEIARNVGRRHVQRSARHGEIADVDEVEPAAPQSSPLDVLEADEILATLRTLPTCYREPLVLRLVLGLSGPEIAEQLGMTKGSVRVNLHRGMSLLRGRL